MHERRLKILRQLRDERGVHSSDFEFRDIFYMEERGLAFCIDDGYLAIASKGLRMVTKPKD